MARQALGKGLGALIPSHLQDLSASERASVTEIQVTQIKPNPHQPRLSFGANELKELADSIREQGLIQPVVVLREKSGGFTLISGERRFRAVQSLGHRAIPAIVKTEMSAAQLALWGLIENIQRADLNPMEEAKAYRKLVEDFKMTQEELAKKVGKDRVSVANILRLLKLPKELQQLLEEEKLSLGHAKVLLALDRPEAQKALAQASVREGWSVRTLEQNVNEKIPAGSKKSRRRGASKEESIELKAMEEKLRRSLGTKVRIHPKGKAGIFEISYFSEEELERLLEHLTARR